MTIFPGNCPNAFASPDPNWCTDVAGAQRSCSAAEYLAPGPVGVIAPNGVVVAFTTAVPTSAGIEGSVWVENTFTRTIQCVGTYSYPPLPLGNVVVAGGYVYWTDFTAGTGQGHIRRALVSADWQSTPETVVSESAYPFRLRATTTHLYWAPIGTGELRRRPLAGGAVEVVASGEPPISSFDVDATHAYWSTSTAVRRRALTGGPASTILALADVAQLQRAGSWLITRNTSTISRWPLDGGALVGVAPTMDPSAPFTSDGQRLYFFPGWTNSNLFSNPLEGPGGGLLLQVARPGDLELDGPWLYVGGDSLWRVPK